MLPYAALIDRCPLGLRAGGTAPTAFGAPAGPFGSTPAAAASGPAAGGFGAPLGTILACRLHTLIERGDVTDIRQLTSQEQIGRILKAKLHSRRFRGRSIAGATLHRSSLWSWCLRPTGGLRGHRIRIRCCGVRHIISLRRRLGLWPDRSSHPSIRCNCSLRPRIWCGCCLRTRLRRSCRPRIGVWRPCCQRRSGIRGPSGKHRIRLRCSSSQCRAVVLPQRARGCSKPADGIKRSIWWVRRIWSQRCGCGSFHCASHQRFWAVGGHRRSLQLRGWLRPISWRFSFWRPRCGQHPRWGIEMPHCAVLFINM